MRAGRLQGDPGGLRGGRALTPTLSRKRETKKTPYTIAPVIAILGDLLDFTADPGFAAPSEAPGVRFRPEHWLLVDDTGRIAGAQADAPGPEWTRIEAHRGRLVMPGFIDTHVHSPQLDVIASYGTALLDWLDTHTFPAERRHADPDVASHAAAHFLDALLAHGTTAAAVYPTVHKASADALFAAAAERGMRLIAGKVLMDRHAPDGLRDDVEIAERDCRELVARWHGAGRLAYAVTVRFAPTSTPDAARRWRAACCATIPGLYMQTHVAENRDEVRWVAELFPDARSYLDVYAAHGLLARAACSRTASGSTTPTAPRWPPPVRRSPTARRRTCSSAAACSTGARRTTRAWRRRSAATSAAAPACRCCARWPTPTRCRRWPARGSPPGRRCMPPRAAPPSTSAWRSEIGTLRRRHHGRSGHLGLGRRRRGARIATHWRATCMSASSPG